MSIMWKIVYVNSYDESYHAKVCIKIRFAVKILAYRPDGSHFAQMGSHFAQNTSSNPCSLLSRNKPLSEICKYTKHRKTHPKTHLFVAWFWKWAKWSTVWAKCIPTEQKVWNVGKTFLEVGKKNLHMGLYW